MLTAEQKTISLPVLPDDRLLTHSSEATWKTCPRKYFLRYKMGLTPAHDSEPLRLGSAVHVGLESIKNGGDEMAAELAVRAEYALADRPPYLDPIDFEVEQEIAIALVRGYYTRWKDSAIIKYIAAEAPFKLPIVNPSTGRATPSFHSAGKIDGIAELPDGKLAIIEHKTTTDDLSLDSDYWKRLMLDSQISRYVLAARTMGYDVRAIIYDVIKKPGIRPKNITKADRANATYLGHYFGHKLISECPERETPAMYGARLLADTIERPDWYFARNEIVRLDSELDEYRAEQWTIQQTIREAELNQQKWGIAAWPRNTSACTMPYRCPYLDICRGMKGDPSEQTPEGFKVADRLHPELVIEDTKGGAL